MNSDQSEPAAIGPRMIRRRGNRLRLFFILWFSTLGIHIGWYTDSVMTERCVLSFEPGVTLTIRAYGHPGAESSLGIPYCLLLSKESLPRSLSVVIDVQGLDHDGQVRIERIVATQDSPKTRHLFEAAILPVKDGLEEKFAQKESVAPGSQSAQNLTAPVTRLSHTLANSITSEGVVSLEFFVSTKNGDPETKSSPPQPVTLWIQQRQEFCVVLGWQALFYSQL